MVYAALVNEKTKPTRINVMLRIGAFYIILIIAYIIFKIYANATHWLPVGEEPGDGTGLVVGGILIIGIVLSAVIGFVLSTVNLILDLLKTRSNLKTSISCLLLFVIPIAVITYYQLAL